VASFNIKEDSNAVSTFAALAGIKNDQHAQTPASTGTTFFTYV
jgi:hypothetical protein